MSADPKIDVKKTGGDDSSTGVLVTQLPRSDKQLFKIDEKYGEISMVERFDKTHNPTGLSARKSQFFQQELIPHPFDIELAKCLKDLNNTHATCLYRTVAAMTGMGFETADDRRRKAAKVSGDIFVPSSKFEDRFSKVDLTLSPLTRQSWNDVFKRTALDIAEVAQGYIEVVWDDNREEILGLFYVPSEHTWFEVEDDGQWHFVITNGGGEARAAAQFGDLIDFRSRAGSISTTLSISNSTETTSEIIQFIDPTNIDEWYGIPCWKSAVKDVELKQALDQHLYDFFNNRGVPEFMLFALGGTIAAPDWDKINKAIQGNVGQGNSYKTMAMQIADPNIKIQLEKLMTENAGANDFSEKSVSIASEIVTAWGVPPLLAGVHIPGKMGSNNELPNSMVAFQTLKVEPLQNMITFKLATTLGNDELNGGLDLTPDDFILNTILDRYDLTALNTMSTMKNNIAEEPDRKLSEGTLKDGR